MAKFKHRPTEVDAEQFVIWDLKKIPMFTKIHDITFPIQDFVNCEVSIHIPTQQGKAIAYNLDWVIKDSLGNLTVESSGTFERNYSKVYYKP